MPIYEYECPQCGPFELMRKVSDPALKRCPTCKAKVSKLMSNTSFQLKGTGWYVTDYARKDSGGAKSNGASDTKDTPATVEAGEKKTKDTKDTKAKAAPVV